MKKVIAMVASCTLLLAGCGSASQKDQAQTLNVEIPLKTTSIAPYDTDVPVKIGAVEALLKLSPTAK